MRLKRTFPVCLFLFMLSFALSFSLCWYTSSLKIVKPGSISEPDSDEVNDGLLLDIKNKQAKDLVEWDEKIETEKSRLERITALWNRRADVLDEEGCFKAPFDKLGEKGYQFYCPMFDEFPVLGKDARKLLKLTEAEQIALDAHTMAIWVKVAAYEKKYMTIKEEGATFTITVQPFEKAGGADIREQFHSGLARILGKSRYRVFKIFDRQARYRLFNASDSDSYSSELMFLGFGRFAYRFTFTNYAKNYRTEHFSENEWLYWPLIADQRQLERFRELNPAYFKNLKERK